MNPTDFSQALAQQLGIRAHQVAATIDLLDSGATVPFVARYRKERTGSLDEVQIAAIRDGLQRLREREQRRNFILQTIEEQGKLTPDLRQQIESADTMTELEDLYLPFKPKRRTRATIARERGLEPLATALSEQDNIAVEPLAKQFVDTEKGVETVEDALAGARDILAEWVNEDQTARANIRQLFTKKAFLISKLIKGKEAEAHKFRDYFDWSEPLNRVPSHRLLAILRGANEGLLRVSIEPDEEVAIAQLERLFVKNRSELAAEVKIAIKDAYKRLMQPSIETEVRNAAKERADLEAITVFADNLRELLLSAPLGEKRVSAIDPGFRTGCKIVCLDEQGTLLHNTTIYPHDNAALKRYQATAAVENLCDEYNIQAIAVGNGTAGRETFSFIQKMGLPDIEVVMVNESGASIYSASDVARAELGNYDLTVRGAVSIGRRLIDPLAELVKIDPKSIGVGQYQHDVDQTLLHRRLDDVVTSCVNRVGVEVNTASPQLLQYVSGIGTKVAQKMVDYRTEKGAFRSRNELKKVSGLGPKAFEQAAGFLRIRELEHPLDKSAVHPERYDLVARMAKDLNCTIADLMENESLRKQIDLQNYVTQEVGLPTLTDIIEELAKPGRDPRSNFETTNFDENINHIEDLREGMVLTGVVTNVTNFGAFVDIGVHQNGLVHVSEITNRRIADAKEVLKVNQQVRVKVVSLDVERGRIGLSMKAVEGVRIKN